MFNETNKLGEGLLNNSENYERISATEETLFGTSYEEEDRSEVSSYRAENLDSLFIMMYQYYVFKGLGVVIISQLCAVCNLTFIVVFSSFLLGFVDWAQLGSDCDVTQDAEALSELCGPALKYISWRSSSVIVGYIVLSLTYLFWRIVRAIMLVRNTVAMEMFCTKKLRIISQDLSGHEGGQKMTWDDLLERLKAYDRREGGGGALWDQWYVLYTYMTRAGSACIGERCIPT